MFLVYNLLFGKIYWDNSLCLGCIMFEWLKRLLDIILNIPSNVPPVLVPTTTTPRPVPEPSPGPPSVPVTTTRPPVTTTTTRPPTPVTTTTTRPPVTTTTTRPPTSTDTMIFALLEEHNNYRAKFFRPPLTLNQQLSNAAMAHAEWMAKTGNFSHTGEGGSSPFDRMRSHGYLYRSAGENIAYGHANVSAVMAGWIGSPGHEANIRGGYINVGFAVVPDRNGRLYWVANFATPAQPATIFESDVTLPYPLLAPGVPAPTFNLSNDAEAAGSCDSNCGLVDKSGVTKK